MEAVNFQAAFLHFVTFSQLNNWNVKQYLKANLLKSKFKIEFLAEHLIEQNNKIKPFDFPEEDFAILGVDNKVGIFDAYVSKGKEIKQPYKKVETGFIAYNPYRINVGSIGLKTEKHQYQYISPAYVVFSCRDTLLPEYLFLVFKTNFYNRIIRENTTGSVRQNLSFDNLVKMQIPLPDINTQKTLVHVYQDKMAKADELEKQANQINGDIEHYLFEQLGIEFFQTQKAQTGKLRFVHFRDLSRWDLLFHSSSSPSIKSKYLMKKISDLIFPLNYEISGKSLRFNSQSKPNDDFYYLGMENIEKNSGQLIEFQKVKGQDIKSQTLRVPKDYFIYGKLRPYLNKYWHNDTEHNNIICSSEFLVFSINNQIDKNYFLSVIGQNFVQKQINDKVSGARMPRLSPDDFLEIQIPLPPLSTQTQIAKHIQTQKQQQKSYLEKANALRLEALAEFETAIFR